jgi:NADPH:quinone reductase-like Zn-dependent oxidoreductase
MKVAAISQPAGLDNIRIEQRPDPTPGPGEVLVRVRASSLNFHDFAVAVGVIPNVASPCQMAQAKWLMLVPA